MAIIMHESQGHHLPRRPAPATVGPLHEGTRGLVDADLIARMRPERSYIVNTARGAICDRGAVVAALESGHLAGGWGGSVCARALDSQGDSLGEEDEEPCMQGIRVVASQYSRAIASLSALPGQATLAMSGISSRLRQTTPGAACRARP